MSDNLKTLLIILGVLALLVVIGWQQQKEKDHCDEIHGDWHYDILYKRYKCN